MTPLETAVRVAVSLLVRREYEAAARVTGGTRLRTDDLREAVEKYGRTLVEPPSEWWSLVDSVPLNDEPHKSHVVVPLWTREEGESDLTWELWAEEFAPGLVRLEALNLHVL